jgi:hypothetical protein
MTCLSTTLQHQRRDEFNGLLRIFVVVTMVMAVCAEAASIRFPVLGFFLVIAPFYLYYLAYSDLLETERFRRPLTNRQKRHNKRVRKEKAFSSVAGLRAKEHASAKSRTREKFNADAEAAKLKKRVKKKAKDKARSEAQAAENKRAGEKGSADDDS